MSQLRTSRVVDERLAAELLVLVGALLGLFAMHGLGDHGAASHEVHEAAMAPPIAAADAAHVAHSVYTDAGDQAPATDSVTAPAVPASGMSMAGLCLAVLAGALVGSLLRRPHRVVVFTRSLVRAFVPVRLSGRRDRDPPCLFELSVLRT